MVHKSVFYVVSIGQQLVPRIAKMTSLCHATIYQYPNPTAESNRPTAHHTLTDPRLARPLDPHPLPISSSHCNAISP